MQQTVMSGMFIEDLGAACMALIFPSTAGIQYHFIKVHGTRGTTDLHRVEGGEAVKLLSVYSSIK